MKEVDMEKLVLDIQRLILSHHADKATIKRSGVFDRLRQLGIERDGWRKTYNLIAYDIGGEQT